MNTAMRKAALALCVTAAMLISCAIEPPLYLPGEDITTNVPMVRVDIEAVWSNPNWNEEFLYGWEAEDIERQGELGYPEPIDYQLRHYFIGEEPNLPHTDVIKTYLDTTIYRAMFNYGYHDLLVWSNIHNADNVQSVVISETLESVDASTNRLNSSGSSRFSEALSRAQAVSTAPARAVPAVYNQPDIFYSAYNTNILITSNPADYDYYDEELKTYFKRLNMELQPLVYIYVVQVILRNNNGKITGASEGAAISGLSKGVNVNYGNTTETDVGVMLDLNMKHGLRVTPRFAAPLKSGVQLKAAVGEAVDVLGGRLTTFGLCGMGSYISTRVQKAYVGTRTDLTNSIAIDFKFRNDADSVITFDVTKQLQNQPHGGIITIEIDANDIPMPHNPNPSPDGSGFDPWIEEYGPGENHEITM